MTGRILTDAQPRLRGRRRAAAPGATRRRRPRRVGVLLLGVLATFWGAAMLAGAASAAPEVTYFDVVEVDGPIDAVNASFVSGALARAEAEPRTVGVLLRVDTPGGLGRNGYALAQQISRMSKPVVTWVYKPGGAAQARGAGLFLVAASHVVTMGADAVLGPLNPADLVAGTDLTVEQARAQLEAIVPKGRSVDGYLAALNRPIGAKAAVASGAANETAGYVGEVFQKTTGKTVVLGSGQVVTLDLLKTETMPATKSSPGGPTQVAVSTTRFFKLTGFDGFLHKINTPTYAYVLLVVGLAAIAFEFYAASIGISGILGALCLLASFQAIGVLPVNWWAVALIFVAMVLFCIDVQVANLGIPTVIGTILALIGSIFFTYSDGYTVRWWSILLVLAGLLLFFAVAMTTVVRTRFSTPTIGRELLVGADGQTKTDLKPDGFVDIDGAVWKARSHRGTIPSGSAVTVRSVDGLVLEVDRVLEEA